MRLDQHLVIAVFLFVGAFALAQKNPDDLKQRIHAQAKGLNADDYAFTRTIRSEENSGAKKEVKVEVETSVNEEGGTPFVEQVHSAVGSTRIKLLFKLQSYEATARYQLGREGKPLLVERVSDIVGSGMGKQGKFHQVTTYSDYRAVTH